MDSAISSDPVFTAEENSSVEVATGGGEDSSGDTKEYIGYKNILYTTKFLLDKNFAKPSYLLYCRNIQWNKSSPMR